MNVAVIGGGPVGLVSGCAFASVGHDVTVVDRDTTRADHIARGVPPFHEPGLDELLARVVAAGKLRSATDCRESVGKAAVVLICVGTPQSPEGHADLTALKTAGSEIGSALGGRRDVVTVLVKSTVPPGTTMNVVAPAVRAAAGETAHNITFGMNPEFLREGVAVADMIDPDRIVVGLDDVRGKPAVEELYRPFSAPLLFTTPGGAEMAKYTSNALLSTLISFSNEIAQLCEGEADVNAREVMQALHLDRRFRSSASNPDAPASIVSYIMPGLGYGGSCFPKDTAALAAWARERSLPTPLLDAVRDINAKRPERVLTLLKSRLDLRGARVAVLGLSFKPGTDDLRESRSLDFARLLYNEGAEVRACDPVAGELAGRLLDGVAAIESDPESALMGADAAVLATAWPQYVALDPRRVRSLMRRPLMVDARGGLDSARWSEHCEYLTIGVKA
ncbi:MAG: UDP-glucose dehydrogenase family protein [Gemmatimonadota bacterium]